MFLKFLFLFISLFFISHPVIATSEKKVSTVSGFTCPTKIELISNQNLVRYFAFSELYDPEEYVCHAEQLWQRGLINDADFFISAATTVNSFAPKREDLAVYILKKSLSLPANKVNSYPMFLAEIHENINSEFFNPDEALHLYLHTEIISYYTGHNPQECALRLRKKAEKLQTSKIHKNALRELAEWCFLSSEDLLELAENYQKGTGNKKKSDYIAYRLYSKLRTRHAFNDNNNEAERISAQRHKELTQSLKNTK